VGDLTVEEFQAKEVAWHEQGKLRVATWQDMERMSEPPEDGVLLEGSLEALGQQLAAPSLGPRVVAVTHMVPLSAGLPAEGGGLWSSWSRAYLGSDRVGELLVGDPRVEAVIFGHAHAGRDFSRGTLRGYNVASPIGMPRLIDLA